MIDGLKKQMDDLLEQLERLRAEKRKADERIEELLRKLKDQKPGVHDDTREKELEAEIKRLQAQIEEMRRNRDRPKQDDETKQAGVVGPDNSENDLEIQKLRKQVEKPWK